MPFLMTSPQINYLNNRSKENFLLTEVHDDYDFKYIPAKHFTNIVKDVQRQKCKEDEERVWNIFMNQQKVNSLVYEEEQIQSSLKITKEIMQENIDERDESFIPLDQDVPPNERKRIFEEINNNNNPRLYPQVKEIENISSKKQMAMRNKILSNDDAILPISMNQLVPNSENGIKCDQVSHTLIKKCCSSHKANHEQEITKQYTCTENHDKHNCSPDVSMRNDNDKEDVICIRPDPLITQKILSLQKKVLEQLDEISYQLERIPLPDGDNDLRRRQQRVTEFTVRFSRNYLYDLNRNVANIQRHVSAIFPTGKVKLKRRNIIFHMQAIEQKLIVTYQLLLHALAAYNKHIPRSTLRNYPGKLKDLLCIVVDLKNICKTIHVPTNDYGSGDAAKSPLGKDTKSKCNSILSKLNIHTDNESQLEMHTAYSTTSFLTSSHTKGLSMPKSILNMCKTDIRMPKIDSKKKLSVYQTRKRRCRPNSKVISDNCALISEKPNLVHASPKEIAAVSRITLQETISQEDEIKTVMDMMSMDSNNDISEELQKRENTFIQQNSIQSEGSFGNISNSQLMKNKSKTSKTSTCDSNDEDLRRQVTMITEEHLSTLVPVIADLMSRATMKDNDLEVKQMSVSSVEVLKQFLQKYHSSISDPESHSTVNCRRYISSIGTSLGQVPNQSKKISLYADANCNSNMQLFCMPYNENTQHYTTQSHNTLVKTKYNSLDPKKSETLIDNRIVNEEPMNISTEDKIILVTSEEAVTRYVEWHKQYEHYSQKNPMYTSNTQNKPWDIVAWISDKLVDELVTEVSKEFQMEDIIQKLFELEFQDF